MSEIFTLESLFKKFAGGIRLPRIQRGYVQGRKDEKEIEIRRNFAPALVDAIFGGNELSLDFIYGVAEEDSGEGQSLLPLDGQQRLSTLLLLAWLCGKWATEWHFTYESRRIPQLFVKGLLEHPCKAERKASEEIEEAGWFLPIWKGDPSVAGMLRMLDTLHDTIGQRKREEADFRRITFLLHGIDGHGDTFDHIFRKMNARGKELSPWENMKAMLDKHVPKELADDWRDKVDGQWAECLWEHADEDIVKLDNAMEKIIRMVYARIVSVDAQNDSLWEIEKKLAINGEGSFDKTTLVTFFQMASRYFDALPIVAESWTHIREQNILWAGREDNPDFWIWLSNGLPASAADLLRMSLLAEKKHCQIKDNLRRRRILLNLLDASSVNKDNFCEMLNIGLRFLAGLSDLKAIKALSIGYSPAQLEDEIQKSAIEENAIISFEKDNLVLNGSLRFIGWMPFSNARDIENRLKLIRTAIEGDKWMDFYQSLASRIPLENFGGRYAYTYTPLKAAHIDVWREKILPDERFIDAIKIWHDGPDAKPEPPAWIQHLVDLLGRGQVNNPTLRYWNGWMFLLQHDVQRREDSIRLDRNENERKHRQSLLRDEQIYYASPWPWAEAKEEGVLYNVCDLSWGEGSTPPKGMRNTDGDIRFVNEMVPEC